MERRSTFRFRLPWSQPAPTPSPAPTPASKPSTQPTSRAPTTRTGSRAASQPSSSSTPTAMPSSSPTTENPTRKQSPSATSTTTSAKPSSPVQPSAGTQGRNEVPTSTTTPIPASPPLPQPSAEMKAPSQPSTSTSPLTETTPIPPQTSAESKAPIQPSTTNTSPLPESTTVPPQPSAESKAPVQSSTTNSTPANAPASPKSETQTPTTAITTTPISTIAQSGPSTPPGVAPSPPSQTRASRIGSQPLIPSQEQQGISSQPASLSDVPTKSRISPPPAPSPSRSAPQSREMTPISSPTRKDPQVLSMDQLSSKVLPPASQSTSSNLPSGITSQMQQKDQIIAQPTSPLKQLQDSSEPSSKSTEALKSISGKEPKFTAIRPQSEQMELLKKETISDTVAEAKVKSPEKVMQPSELSEVKSTRSITQEPSQISDSSGIIDEPKMVRQSETNIQETREVKEVEQERRDKNYGTGEKIGGLLTSTKQPGTAFQSKKAYTEKQSNSDNDQIRVNLVSNGKHKKTVSSEPKNKTIVNSSSKETAGFAEQDIPLNKEVKDNISKFIHRMAVGDGKQNLEEGPVSVITLAGDNRGASMQLGSDSSRKEGAIHIHRGYKLNPDESADATDAEGYSEGRRPKDARTMEDQEIEAYLNCNVQGLNNSITFDSAIAAKNPGIHMLFPHMPSEPIRSSEKTGPFEAHKAEFNVTPAQKLTYEPKIRRRCLTGLFLEPSDSDPDNPEKSPRHGCHVGCMEKSDDNEIDIL
ncbi:hypothetical protein A4A49_01516 [Nicotiana attenuata]|uniref:Uncharacterized protein n=1 Tax=Nicotiana attenuata TaxID=49451 RepID=A0A1J6IZ17_NICAT|nr:hypothetical protein A4A49_01516 [Nicotiana attenuata]